MRGTAPAGTRRTACARRPARRPHPEEQFGIPAWRHHGTFAALELEKAGNPTPALERTEDLALLIVQRSAPVAHQCPTGMGSNNRAPGVHTVLQRHAGSEALRIARFDPVLW